MTKLWSSPIESIKKPLMIQTYYQQTFHKLSKQINLRYLVSMIMILSQEMIMFLPKFITLKISSKKETKKSTLKISAAFSKKTTWQHRWRSDLWTVDFYKEIIKMSHMKFKKYLRSLHHLFHLCSVTINQTSRKRGWNLLQTPLLKTLSLINCNILTLSSRIMSKMKLCSNSLETSSKPN